ncbi:MAG TPA: NUDIX domain-containing protein [Anaerolineales bacterium]|jgi:8-oxo-dGTP pyrophosphatase MutT (NUDIX family)|nr:NUDIX domain-containing protein [Anaerolineales bacterium]
MNQIRPLAICVFRYGDRILVAEGYDSIKHEYFYRPLGGGIEFGENSAETISREIREEINAEIDSGSLKYLGSLENIFSFNGNKGHEIVMIYDGVLRESSLYEQQVIAGKEANGEDIRAVWKNINEFGAGKAILYPAGLLEILG